MAFDRGIFPRLSVGDWRRAAGRDPAPFVTEDGVSIAPLRAGRSDAAPLGGAPGWRIVQRLTASDAETAIREASSAIAGGVNGIEIVFATSAHPLRSRLPLDAAARIADGLRSFGVPDITFRIDAGAKTTEAAAPFAELARGTGATLVLAYDAIGQFAATSDPGWPRLVRGPMVTEALAAGTNVRGARVIAIADGRLWNAGGATEVQELAAVLATLVAFYRAGEIRDAYGVALAADTQLFTTLAKVRAMRQLLARLAEVVEAPATVPIHVETAWRARTRVEPKMNVLRATIATLAAVAGGADSLTVLPFDAGDADSQRLARNTQLVARYEASLGRVADPGAGAGAIEAMTDAFAGQAWAAFQAIEGDGGMAAPAALERLTQRITEARQRRSDRVVKGETPLVGVNVHVAGDADFGIGLVDSPRTLLRYTPLDADVMPPEDRT